jgi:hypothetical protein
LFDFDMVGSRHDGIQTVGDTLALIKSSLAQTPVRAALCGGFLKFILFAEWLAFLVGPLC